MDHPRHRRRALTLLVAGATGLVTASAPLAPAAGAIVTRTASLAVTPVLHDHIARTGSQSPPTTRECKRNIGVACYSPLQYQNAYNVKALYNQGITGAGKTIFIVDSFGSPTIRDDVAAFDADFGLPAVSLDVIQPAAPRRRSTPPTTT